MYQRICIVLIFWVQCIIYTIWISIRGSNATVRVMSPDCLLLQHVQQLLAGLALQLSFAEGERLPSSHVEGDQAVADILEHRDRLTVRFALQDISVDRQNLVAYEYNIGTAMEIRINI